MSSLVVYIKPTNYCNVDCEHCYLPLETRQNKETISFDKLREVFEFSAKVVKKEKHQGVEIIWHGGEPMMLSPEWYEKAHVIADEVFEKEDMPYFASIQTSLLPYNKGWNNLIKKRFYNFVGTSIDFSTRSFNGSNEKYIDTFMKRINLLRDSDIDVTPGFVPAKSEINAGKNIVRWFVDNGFNYFNFERYTNYTNKNDINYPSNIDYSNFMIDVFDELMSIQESGEMAPVVKPIVAAINGVKFGYSGDRWGTTCQSLFIIVEPNGDLNTCPDRANVEEPFSNIDDGHTAFLRSKKRRLWIRESMISHKGNHCLNCEYRSWCKSGCPINPNDPNSEFHQECAGYKKFLNHVKSYLDSDKEKFAIEYLSNKWED